MIRTAVHKYWEGAPDWRWWKAQLYQESTLDPAAVSPAGAAGLAQFMPASWVEVSHQLGWSGISPHVAKYAIDGGAYYMVRLRQVWVADRPLLERHRLAQASYNAGTGNVLAAQARCQGAARWDAIKICLGDITGAANARQTIDYIDHIAAWYQLMR